MRNLQFDVLVLHVEIVRLRKFRRGMGLHLVCFGSLDEARRTIPQICRRSEDNCRGCVLVVLTLPFPLSPSFERL